MTPNLIDLTYSDSAKKISLYACADTIVYDIIGSKRLLCLARFGGYPEQVNSITHAISGGATVDIAVGTEHTALHTERKRYRCEISHDGIYAEAVVRLEDEQQQSLSADDPQTQDVPPRRIRIYTAPGDDVSLFDAIDARTCVPLLPEFREYLLGELKQSRILTPMTVHTISRKFDAWALTCAGGDKNIIEVVESGLRSGAITIPDSTGSSSALDDVKTVTQYLTAFGPQIAERIKHLFVPLFDPATDDISQEVLRVNEYIRENAGYSLYDAQLAVAEAIKRRLRNNRAGIIVAECGVGKTKIGSAAMSAALHGLGREHRTFNVILCPSHIKEKWVREIEESLPDTFAAVVNNITELDALYALYEKGTRHCFAIISKETARDGYMRMPSVDWNHRKQGFVCPECGEVVLMPISDDGSMYMVNADQFFFRTQNRNNNKCTACGTPLWTVVNPTAARKPPWKKIGDYGFVFVPAAKQHLNKKQKAQIVEKITALINDPDAFPVAAGAHRKYPLNSYIKRKYRGRIDGMIFDELHQYAQNSGQGDAMNELFGAARKVIGIALQNIAENGGRKFALIHFSGSGLFKTDVFIPGRYSTGDVFASIETFLHGGTNFATPLNEALRLIENDGFSNADIVFITDGECLLPDALCERLKQSKTDHKFTVTGVLLDTESPGMESSLTPFCDAIYHASELSQDKIAERLITAKI